MGLVAVSFDGRQPRVTSSSVSKVSVAPLSLGDAMDGVDETVVVCLLEARAPSSISPLCTMAREYVNNMYIYMYIYIYIYICICIYVFIPWEGAVLSDRVRGWSPPVTLTSWGNVGPAGSKNPLGGHWVHLCIWFASVS